MTSSKPSNSSSINSVETLSSASADRPSCQECGLLTHCKTPFLKPSIPKGWTGKILGVGEQPGDLAVGLVSRMLRAAGFQERDFATVGAIRCPSRKAPTMRQLRACRPFLLRVVEQLKPGVVVAFGAAAAKGLLDRGSASVTALRGRVQTVCVQGIGDVPAQLTPLRVTYSPEAVLRGATHLEKRIVDDLRRIRTADRRELEIVSGVMLTDKVLSIDTEYTPTGELLTISLAGVTKARVWDVEGSGGTA